MNGIDQVTSLPLGLQIGLGVVLCVQLVLMVTALVVLVRAPKGPVAGLPKPAWAAIILLLEVVGSIVFLVLARRDARERVQREELTVRLEKRPRLGADSVVDELYGERS